MTWGPFTDGLDPVERRARLRCLRLAVRLLCGPRGAEACGALLAAQVDPHPDTLGEAQVAFDRLGSLDQRRVLSAFRETV